MSSLPSSTCTDCLLPHATASCPMLLPPASCYFLLPHAFMLLPRVCAGTLAAPLGPSSDEHPHCELPRVTMVFASVEGCKDLVRPG